MPPKGLPLVDKNTRSMSDFFRPSQNRDVCTEHKVSAQLLKPVPQSNVPKRKKTVKKVASFSSFLQQSFPWAICLEDPDPEPFTALVTEVESGMTGPVEFIERGDYPLQMCWQQEMIEIDAEKITFCADEIAEGTCYLCCEKYGEGIALWACSACML